MPILTIIIPTYNQVCLLKKTLESLNSCSLLNSLLRVIVVENGKKLTVEHIIKTAEYSFDVEYEYCELANKSNALNKVLSRIDNSYVILFDDDIRLDPYVLSAYYQAIVKYGRGYFWGGRVGSDLDGPAIPDHLIEFFPDSVKGFDLGDQEIEVNKPVFLGCNWAFYSEDLKSLGGFDCNYGPGSATGSVGQETNAMTKLLNAGLKAVYLPNAKVWHYVPQERSSFDWLINRKYKIGIRAGLVAKQEQEPKRSVAGIPLWFFRGYLVSAYRRYFKSFFTQDKNLQARYVLDHCHNQGMLKAFLTKV